MFQRTQQKLYCFDMFAQESCTVEVVLYDPELYDPKLQSGCVEAEKSVGLLFVPATV